MTTTVSPARTRRFRVRAVPLALLLAAATYITWDLFSPRSEDLRDFDPKDVARLETKMWRAYSSGEKLPLLFDVAELLRSEYRLPFLRSNLTAFYAARAAFVFKQSRSRADCEQALPDLRRFYSVLHEISNQPLDADKAAHLELEWWMLHRDRSPQLEQALAALQAEIFHVTPTRVAEHAHYRAEAIRVRDDHGDWGLIAKLLRQSWSSLARVLQS